MTFDKDNIYTVRITEWQRSLIERGLNMLMTEEGVREDDNDEAELLHKALTDQENLKHSNTAKVINNLTGE